MISIAAPRVRVTGPPAPGLKFVITAQVDNATALLGFTAIRPAARVMVAEIQKKVAEHYGISVTELLGSGRCVYVARPRQVSMWLCRKLTTRSFPDIGRRHGQRDHSTAHHAVQRIDALRAVDPTLASDCTFLLAELGGMPA